MVLEYQRPIPTVLEGFLMDKQIVSRAKDR